MIFTALVNIHHFILDGAIWKLRDGRIAQLLLNSQERISSETAKASNHAIAGLRWLIGDSKRAHALRVTTALVLLTWAGIDQVRYYYRVHSENIANLQLAASLNSFDSGLQTWLGRRKLESGHPDAAAEAWRKALRLNPADSGARDGLLQYLISQKRYDEAYRITQQSLRYAPDDTNLLVNNGMLASQTGNRDQAITSWKRAMAIDPSQVVARLYFAGALQEAGKCDEAIPQYLNLLAQVSRSDPSRRPSASIVLEGILGLGTCQEKMQTNCGRRKILRSRPANGRYGRRQKFRKPGEYERGPIAICPASNRRRTPVVPKSNQARSISGRPTGRGTRLVYLRDLLKGFPLVYTLIVRMFYEIRVVNEGSQSWGELNWFPMRKLGLKNIGRPVTPENLQSLLDEALQLTKK